MKHAMAAVQETVWEAHDEAANEEEDVEEEEEGDDEPASIEAGEEEGVPGRGPRGGEVQRVRVVIHGRAKIVEDEGELALAERALGLDLAPVLEAGEAELVEAGVCPAPFLHLAQADGADIYLEGAVGPLLVVIDGVVHGGGLGGGGRAGGLHHPCLQVLHGFS